MATKIEQSSANVFRDLGFSRQEAESLQLRAELMVQITRLIKKRKITQAAAAKLFGVTQPRISDLVRGKIDLFSIDGLVEMLARAGMRVQVHVAPRRGRRRHSQAA
jgi:predicted XRE-type DNA-binding protein